MILEEDLGTDNEFVSMVLTSSRRLETMLESVLELARLEANDVELRPKSIDVLEEVTDVVRSFRPRAEEKEIDLSVISHVENGDAVIRTDGEIIRQIVHRLIDNAVKFTHVGGVTFGVEGKHDGVRIRIEDSGVGMDASFLSELYAPFKQASEGLARQYEGSGLGLTIVRRLVDLLGADMNVESTVGEGTVVALFVPSPSNVAGYPGGYHGHDVLRRCHPQNTN